MVSLVEGIALDLAVITFDARLMVKGWSEGAEQLSGLPAAGIVGRGLLEAYSSEDERRSVADIASAALRGQIWEGSWTHRRVDGTRVRCSARFEPAYDGAGAVSGGIVVVRPLEPAENELGEHYRRSVEFGLFAVGERNLTPSTVLTYGQNRRRIEKWCGKLIEQMTVEDVRRFLRHSKFHPATKGATLVGIKEYLRFGLVEGWADLDLKEVHAILALRGPRQVNIPGPSLTLQQVNTLLDACRRPNEHRVVRHGLYSGLRISESASIGIDEWVPCDGGTGFKLRFVGKGRKVRDVPVHPELLALRAEILSTSPSRGTLKHVVRSLAFYTGIPFTSHTLRRTFSVRHDQLGVDESVILQLMGHEQPTILRKHYAPVREDKLVEAQMGLHYRA